MFKNILHNCLYLFTHKIFQSYYLDLWVKCNWAANKKKKNNTKGLIYSTQFIFLLFFLFGTFPSLFHTLNPNTLQTSSSSSSIARETRDEMVMTKEQVESSLRSKLSPSHLVKSLECLNFILNMHLYTFMCLVSSWLSYIRLWRIFLRWVLSFNGNYFMSLIKRGIFLISEPINLLVLYGRYFVWFSCGWFFAIFSSWISGMRNWNVLMAVKWWFWILGL